MAQSCPHKRWQLRVASRPPQSLQGRVHFPTQGLKTLQTPDSVSIMLLAQSGCWDSSWMYEAVHNARCMVA